MAHVRILVTEDESVGSVTRYTPADLPKTEAMLRYLISKQHHCARCGKKNCRWSKAGYRPLSQQEILEAAGEYSAEYGKTLDETLYFYCKEQAVTNGTFVAFLNR